MLKHSWKGNTKRAGQAQEVTKEPEDTPCESPRGPRRTSSVLSFSWTRRKPWQVLHLWSRWEAHRNHGSRQAHRSVLQLLPQFSIKVKKRASTFKPKAGARQWHTHHRWYKLLTPAAGGRTQGGQSPETGTLGVGLAQSVVDLRYQNRARKSSLHVMKPGLVGECTIQRTMLLWPRESRFLRSAVLESQQQRLMVLSSGSKI